MASLTYDHALSARKGRWRGLLAIVLLLIGFGIASLVLGVVATFFDLATGRSTLERLAAGQITYTPAVMLANNLSLALLIPLSMGLQRLLFGVKVGFLASVAGRFRWRWMLRFAAVVAPVWVVYVAVDFVLSGGGEFRIDADAVALLVIVVLTQPLQSAGEEYGARGLIQRSVGSWFRRPWLAFAIGTLVSASLFCLAHFAADPWLIAYYFLFGVSASLMARFSGGIEAPILLHAVNNVLAFIPTILLGQLTESFDRSEGTGNPTVLIPVALLAGVVLFTRWWARRSGVATTVSPPTSSTFHEQANAQAGRHVRTGVEHP